MVGDPIRAGGGRDVDLDHHHVRHVVEKERLNMFVGDRDLVVPIEVGGESGQTQRRKQRVLDRPEQGTRGLGESRKNHFDTHEVDFSEECFLL